MRFSVALCVYNGERFLAEQLESIALQTRLPDEVVICDDDSSDGTSEIVEAFAARAPFLVRYYRNEVNLQVSKNFEKAIGLCDGEIIVTADQDDVWVPEKLSRIEAEFERRPDVGLVFSDADLIDEDGKLLGLRLWPTVRFAEAHRKQLEAKDPFKVLIKRQAITGATMSFRSKFKDLILPIAPGWLHDEWIGLMISSTAKLRAVREPLIRYRLHANNQVGVSGLNEMQRMKSSLRGSREGFFWRVDQFQLLRDALSSRLPGRPELLAMIDQKITHFQARGSLPAGRLGRLSGVFRELASLRYSRYSGTTLCFVRDLVLP